MTVRALSTFMAIWMGFAIVGGLVDGQLIPGYSATGAHTGDAEAMQQALQPDILTSPSEGGLFSSLTSWFAASVSFLSGWASMLTLNFSFFSGSGLATMIGWIVRAVIGIPMITMIAMQVFGR